MWIKTVWHWICILVFLYGLIDLLLIKDKVFYKSGFTNVSDTYSVSVCLKIESSRYDCSSLEGENLLVCEKLKQYFQYVENGKGKNPREILRQFNRSDLKIPALFGFSDSEESECNIIKKYNYLNLNHLCTLYQVNHDSPKWQGLQFVFFNNFHLTLKLFVHPKNVARYERYEYLSCEHFKSCQYFHANLREYITYHLPSNSEVNCIDYESKRFYFEKFEPITSQSICLQECIKYRNRFFEFFYSENDTLPIEFNKTEHYEQLDSVLSHRAKHCQTQCSRPSCSLKYLAFRGIVYSKQRNNVTVEIKGPTLQFEAMPYIRPLDFWRKSLGFISLFFKISILSLVLNANHFLRSKMQPQASRKKSILSIVLVFVWLGLVSSFFCGSVLVESIYNQYKQSDLTPYIYYEVPLVPINFSIAICEPVAGLGNTKVLLSKLEEAFTPAKRFKEEAKFIFKYGYKEEKLVFSNEQFFYMSQDQERLKHCFSTDVHIKEAR